MEKLSLFNRKLIGFCLLAACLAACAGGVPTASPTPAASATGGIVTTIPAPELSATSTRPSASPLPVLTDTALPSQALAATATPVPPTPTQAPLPAAVTTFPDPAGYTWRVVASDLTRPIGIANAGDGSGRLFVVEQPGLIRILQAGQLLPDPFLDIRAIVGSQGSERGLLGLAFHPQYAQNGYFYVNYTDLNGNTVIARFNVSGDPDRADLASQKVLLRVDQPYPNHNGGSTVFGPDGYLYLGLGDGGSGGDPHGNGQSLNTLLGKILRIDVDHGDPYAIPHDNPFAGGGGLPEIWAYGLRNPWRFSFDRLTGDLYIGDVGQDRWEEIDFLPAGSPGGTNFGWNYREGLHPYQGTPPPGLQLVDPVAEYGHDLGCAVTGGVVYRGRAMPAWQGIYLFGDYCSGRVWGLLRAPDGTWGQAQLFESGVSVTSFGEDEAGEVYLAAYQGSLYQLVKK
jgi:glucose/arabinose dehydrogenase